MAAVESTRIVIGGRQSLQALDITYLLSIGHVICTGHRLKKWPSMCIYVFGVQNLAL